MFFSISQFTEEWKEQMTSTQRLFDALTDESLNQEMTENHRPLGQIAWHLVTSMTFLSSLGLSVSAPKGGELAPTSAAMIAEEYRRMGNELLVAVETQWDDAKLMETTELFGQSWKNGASLRFLVQHNIHHCGQMTVLMRQAGLQIPGLFGPTKEEWVGQGKEPLV